MRAIDGNLMRDPFPGLNVCWSTLVLGTGHLIFSAERLRETILSVATERRHF